MYKVTVGLIFTAHNVQFMPGSAYQVSDEVYNGKTDDDKNFKDMCLTAEPVVPITPMQQ